MSDYNNKKNIKLRATLPGAPNKFSAGSGRGRDKQQVHFTTNKERFTEKELITPPNSPYGGLYGALEGAAYTGEVSYLKNVIEINTQDSSKALPKVPDGKGKVTLKNGDTFEGIFENGKMKNGVYFYKDGDQVLLECEGNFRGNNPEDMEGKCTYTFFNKDGSKDKYEGQFLIKKDNNGQPSLSGEGTHTHFNREGKEEFSKKGWFDAKEHVKKNSPVYFQIKKDLEKVKGSKGPEFY